MKKLLVGAVLLAIGAGGAWWAMRPAGFRAGQEVIYIVPAGTKGANHYLPTGNGKVMPGTKLRLIEDERAGMSLMRAMVIEGDTKGAEVIVDIDQIRLP